TTPNTLIFVDLASDDPAAAGKFYNEVFGWRDDERPRGVFHRMVPGGNYLNPDGSESEIGNLHLGIFKASNARPHPRPSRRRRSSRRMKSLAFVVFAILALAACAPVVQRPLTP